MGAKKPIRTFDEQQAVSEWAVAGTAVTAGAAAASKAAESQVTHYLTAVRASYDEAQVGLLEIRDGGSVGSGGTVVFRGFVHDQETIEFAKPLELTKGNAVHAELAAGAAGVDGVVSIAGHSI